MSDMSDALAPEQKLPVMPEVQTAGVEPGVPVMLSAAGNAAIARMLRGGGAGARPDLAGLGSNSQTATLAGPAPAPAQVAEPPAPGGAPPAPAAGTTPDADLKPGSQGEGVREVQIQLSRVQASSKPLLEDGTYGPQTEAAVRNFQTTSGITATGILDPDTAARLNSAFAALPPPSRVELKFGMSGVDVGFAQQKLNAAGATPRLNIDAVYDNPMLTAVVAYEIGALHRFPTTVVDAAMWAALDAGTPGGFIANEGANGVPVEQNTQSGTANSLGTQVAGTSLHPVTGVGGLTTGPAVHELQEKLNTAGTTPALKDDGAFGPKTTAALQAFQSGRTPALPANGTADKATWDALDKVAPGSMIGSVSREWTEQVGGATYGMTGADASRYSWEIKTDRMVVTVKVNFVGLAPPGSWFGFVTNVWNKYKGVDKTSQKSMPIDFQMVRGGGGDSNKVQVKAGDGRANAGQWFLADSEASATIPHEFGHLIGLQDEYQLHAGDFVNATGHEPPVGDATGPAVAPATIAANLQTAIVARSGKNAKAASVDIGVKPGAFAERVVEAYAALPVQTVPAVAAAPGPPPVAALPQVVLTGDLQFDLNAACPESDERYDTIQVFSYSSGSIMGDQDRVKDPHDHGAQPRHLGEFAAILGKALGGTWEAERR